jgi:predicted nuclease of predicted toxin-antitoxin system
LLPTANANSLRCQNMKLLFDQNLSHRLVERLNDIYPDSTHVREVGLRDADDLVIWQYAGAHGYAIVSKDSDFQLQYTLSTWTSPSLT